MRSILVACVLFCFVQVCAAETLSWNTVVPGWWCGLGNNVGDGYPYWNYCISYVHSPAVTAQQNVRVLEIDTTGHPTGVTYPCGSRVPEGSGVRFEFLPRSGTDISWFGTGGAQDSPYGAWGAYSAPPQQVCQESDFVGSYNFGAAVDQYVSVIAAPSLRTVEVKGAECVKSGEHSDCSNVKSGTITGTFSINETAGKVYHQYYRHDSYGGNGQGCYPSADAMQFIPDSPEATTAIHGGAAIVIPGLYGGTAYTLSMPAQSLTCPLTVIPREGVSPSRPSLTSHGTCSTGLVTMFDVVATDPDNDRIRYFVDWNNDGIADQIVPDVGYVPSGTVKTISRVFAAPGTKTVHVLAQDERGLVSSWATITVPCAQQQDTATTEVNGGSDDVLTNDFGSDTLADGTVPDIVLRVLPSLVRKGSTTTVSWSAIHVASCVLFGSNGDNVNNALGWNALISPLGGAVTSPITSHTVYTLRCVSPDGATLEKHADVRIAPTWVEQ